MSQQDCDLARLGLNVRRRCHVMRLTQKELAERLGCSVQTISRIEHGANIPVETVVRLSRALEWTLPELLHGV